MRVRVLITGVSGFAGSHLAEFIVSHHPDVTLYGTYRWRGRLDNLDELARRDLLDVVEGAYQDAPALRDPSRRGRLTLLECALPDPGAVGRVVAARRPHQICHLSGQS